MQYKGFIKIKIIWYFFKLYMFWWVKWEEEPFKDLLWAKLHKFDGNVNGDLIASCWLRYVDYSIIFQCLRFNVSDNLNNIIFRLKEQIEFMNLK